MKKFLPSSLGLLFFMMGFFAHSQIIDSCYIYPNPVQNEVTVHLETSLFGRFDLKLFAINGQEVLAPFTDSILWPGIHEWELDVSALNNGVYFLIISSHTGEERIVKLVKNGPVNVNEIHPDELRLFPNPANNWVKIPDGVKEFTIFDWSGKLVFKQENPRRNWDVSILKPGLYVVELKGDSIHRQILQIQR